MADVGCHDTRSAYDRLQSTIDGVRRVRAAMICQVEWVLNLFGRHYRPVIELICLFLGAVWLGVVSGDHPAFVLSILSGSLLGLAIAETSGASSRGAIFCVSLALTFYGPVMTLAPMRGAIAAVWPHSRADLDLVFAQPWLWVVWFALASVVPLAVQAALMMAVLREPYREKSGVLGDARWATLREVAQVFPKGGDIIVGEAYRVDGGRCGRMFKPATYATWGRGGRAPLVTFSAKSGLGSGHMINFAGSGMYKTTSSVVPTALAYSGSLVVLDPAAEIGALVGAYRANKHVIINGIDRGLRKVVKLDPMAALHGSEAHNAAPDAPYIMGCDCMKPLLASRLLLADTVAFAQLMQMESKDSGGSNQFFQQQALNLLTGLLAYVLVSEECAGRRTLASLRDFVARPEKELKMVLTEIVAFKAGEPSALRHIKNDEYRVFVRQTLGAFVGMADQTFSLVTAMVAGDTQWLSLPQLREMVVRDDFELSGLPKGGLDVFIQVPPALMKVYPGLARVLLGSMMRIMEAAAGNYDLPVLYICDEVSMLGRMSIFEECLVRGRKLGQTMMMFYQSVAQLEEAYGKEGASNWFDSVSFVSYAGISSQETVDRVSKLIGDYTVTVEGSSASRSFFAKPGSATRSFSAQKRPLILPEELLGLRSDEQIVIAKGQLPVRLGRAIYFRRPEMVAKLGRTAFSDRANGIDRERDAQAAGIVSKAQRLQAVEDAQTSSISERGGPTDGGLPSAQSVQNTSVVDARTTETLPMIAADLASVGSADVVGRKVPAEARGSSLGVGVSGVGSGVNIQTQEIQTMAMELNDAIKAAMPPEWMDSDEEFAACSAGIVKVGAQPDLDDPLKAATPKEWDMSDEEFEAHHSENCHEIRR